MTLRVKVRWGPSSLEADLFGDTLIARRRATLPFFCSLAAHLAVVALLLLTPDFVFYPESNYLDVSAYRVQMIQVRAPELVYVPPPPPAVRRPPVERPPAERPTVQARIAPAPRPKPRWAVVTRQLELPPVARHVPDEPVILQPDFNPRMKAPPRLPSLALWTPPFAVTRPARRQLVLPGGAAGPAKAPLLDAPPALAVPNRQPLVSDLNISLPRPAISPARLPVANSSTAPVRLRNNEPGRGSSFELPPAELTRMIILGSAQLAGSPTVPVPRGLQNVPPFETAGGPQGTDSKGATASASGAGAGAAASGDGRTAGNGPPTTVPSALPISGEAARAVASAPQAIRHSNPPEGTFDIVVMQSVSANDLPDVNVTLAGSPVYTVYLPVGDEREWLLEYCLPAKAKPELNPYQITVGDTAPIAPPYPVNTSIPEVVRNAERFGYLAVHGFLTAAGSFRDMALPESANGFLRELAVLLKEWRFRPASRDRQPVEVEVLLIVPPRVR